MRWMNFNLIQLHSHFLGSVFDNGSSEVCKICKSAEHLPPVHIDLSNSRDQVWKSFRANSGLEPRYLSIVISVTAELISVC